MLSISRLDDHRSMPALAPEETIMRSRLHSVTYLSTISLCPCFSVKRIHDSSSRRFPSIRLLQRRTFSLSFFSSTCCKIAISAFHLSRMALNISQHSPRAVRITAPDKATLRLAHTALVMSYSVAFSGSVGRLLGSGEGSSICNSPSEPEL